MSPAGALDSMSMLAESGAGLSGCFQCRDLWRERPDGRSHSDLPNDDRGASESDRPAVNRQISDARSHQIPDQNRGRSNRDRIGRSDTGRHIGNTSRRHETDYHGRFARRKDGSANVRDNSRHHRAHMHVA
jgi:hypothetical protein